MRRLLPCDPANTSGTPPVDLVAAYALPAGRPHLRVNFVASTDGAAAADGLSGALSGPIDKEVFFVLRGSADVILVGAATALAEGYGPVRRTGTGHRPPIALVTRHPDDLDPGAPFFTEAAPDQRPLVLTTTTAPVTDALRERADVLAFGADDVDLGAALDLLRARGLHRVLCEGGPRLFGSLLAADLVDELALTIAPLVAGPGATRMIAGDPIPALPRPATPISLLEEAGWLFTRYSLREV